MKIDADEKELLDSVEPGEWKSAKGGKRERARYSRYAKATFRKDRRLNIRLSSKDLEAIQKRALAEGLPYQTLIASVLHKYASGPAQGGVIESLLLRAWPDAHSRVSRAFQSTAIFLYSATIDASVIDSKSPGAETMMAPAHSNQAKPLVQSACT